MREKKPTIDRYGVKQTEDGYKVDAKSLLASVGGVRGLIEASIPGFLYVLTFAFTRSVPISITVVAVATLILAVRHFMLKRPWDQLVGPIVGVVLAFFLTRDGQAENYYIPGFWTNGAYAAGLLLSVLIRFPAIGLIVGPLTGEGLSWRKDKRKVRFFNLVTLLWVGFFSLRLAIQLPLYFAGEVVILGFVRLVMGTPFFLVMIWLSWLLLRKVITPAIDGNLDK